MTTSQKTAASQDIDAGAEARRKWNTIKNSGNPETLQSFLATYPDSEFAPRARTLLASLLEIKVARDSWNSVRDTREPKQMEAFLRRYPDSEFAPLARSRLESLKSEQAAIRVADTTPPAIDVPSRIDTDQAVIDVGGRVTDDSAVVELALNDRAIALGSGNRFRVQRAVPVGTSELRIAALDEWGNRAEKRVVIERTAVEAQPMAEPPAAIEVEPMDEEYVAVRNANVRAAPTTDSERLTTLGKGTNVTITGKVKGIDWYRIEREGGGEGYVFASLVAEAATESAEVAPQPDSEAIELAFWESVKDTGDTEMIESYLERYPAGMFADLARRSLELLGQPGPGIDEAATQPVRAVLPPPDLDFGRYHALVIGINDYQSLPRLETAVNDASAVADVLRQRYGFDVNLLLNPTRDQVVGALDGLRGELNPRDNLLVYYAGHGVLDQEADRGFWQPVDAEEGTRTDWISISEVTGTVRAMAAKHVLVISDSCYSGTITRGMSVGIKTVADIRKLSERRSRTALVSGGFEPVYDDGGDGHSVFTRALLTTLRENEGVLDGTTLFTAIRPAVLLNTPQKPRYSDIREAGHDDGDFLFVPVVTGAMAAGRETGAQRATSSEDLVVWKTIQESSNPADFELFLESYPASPMAPFARNRLKELAPE